MQQPSVYLGGFLIHEPVTVLTNLMLCAVCFSLAVQLYKSHAKYWVMFFGLLSFAAFFGSLGHGLYLDKNNVLQMISRIAISIAVFAGCIASIDHLKNINLKKFLTVFSFFQISAVIVLIMVFNDFLIVKWNGILGIGVIMGSIHTYLLMNGNRGSRFVIIGIVLNSMAGLIHRFHVSPNKWFNHNDLGHMVVMAGFYLMAIGAMRLENYATK